MVSNRNAVSMAPGFPLNMSMVRRGPLLALVTLTGRCTPLLGMGFSLHFQQSCGCLVNAELPDGCCGSRYVGKERGKQEANYGYRRSQDDAGNRRTGAGGRRGTDWPRGGPSRSEADLPGA